MPKVTTFSFLLQLSASLFCMLVLFPASCLFLVAFEFCLWPCLYSWFLYIMGSHIPCRCDPPSLPAALRNRCSVVFFFLFFPFPFSPLPLPFSFLFLLRMFHIVATHFLLKTMGFLPFASACGLVDLIPWACSPVMGLLTLSAACCPQAPLCPFHVTRVLKSSLSSPPLTPCAALLVAFWTKMGMSFHSFLPSLFQLPLCSFCRYCKQIKPKHNDLILLKLKTPFLFP